MLVDPHCHLDDPAFEGRLGAVMGQALQAGIGGALIPCYGPERWERQGRLLRQTRELFLWAGFGLHPWAIGARPDLDFWLAELERGWRHHGLSWGDRLVAIGEFGLDRSRRMAGVPLELQQGIFAWHLRRARQERLPLILHLVRADGMARELLGKDAPWPGVVHGFSSHRDTVASYLDLGLHLSFGDGLQRSQKVRDALAATPLDRVMFETDGPGPRREGVWGPARLIEIVQAASQVLGKSVEYLLARHRENCARVFGLVHESSEDGS